MWRKWVIAFCQDVLAADERRIRLPRVAPEARGHTIGSCGPAAGPQCAAAGTSDWTTLSLSDNNVHVSSHVMLCLSEPTCCSRVTIASAGFFETNVWLLGIWLQAFFLSVVPRHRGTAEHQRHLVPVMDPDTLTAEAHTNCGAQSYKWNKWDFDFHIAPVGPLVSTLTCVS